MIFTENGGGTIGYLMLWLLFPTSISADELVHTDTPVAIPYLNDLSIFTITGGGWSSEDKYPRFIADVDGDGKTDIIGFGEKGVYVSLSNGEGFETSSTWYASGFCNAIGGWTSNDKYPRMMADVNGDGKADIVGFGENGVYVSLSNGGGFETSSTWYNIGFCYGKGGWKSNNKYPRMMADVNGDGKADIVGFGESSVYVALSNGEGFEAASIWYNIGFCYGKGGWKSNDKYPRMMADVNGDGKADIVGFGESSVYVALSNGGGFEAATIWYNIGFCYGKGGWSSNDKYPRMMADIDGDGLADIIGFGAIGIQLALSHGSSFGEAHQYSSLMSHTTGWNSWNSYPRFAGDTNADGQVDLIGFGYSSVMHLKSVHAVNCAYGCFVPDSNRTNVSVRLSDIESCLDFSFCSGADVSEYGSHTIPSGGKGTVYGWKDAFDDVIMETKCVDTAIYVACELSDNDYVCTADMVNEATGGLVSQAIIKSTEMFGENDVSKTIKHCNGALSNVRSASRAFVLPFILGSLLLCAFYS
jgi:hypothetical protein